MEHLQHLWKVFKRLQQAGLMLKLKKFEFGHTECKYLGRQVLKDGIKLKESKVVAIQQMEQPKTKKDICIFLGMTGYYWRFIQEYATIAEPLTNLRRA